MKKEKTGYLVLDFKTTQLNRFSEVLSCSIIDQDGDILMDTLVKPNYTKEVHPIDYFHNITQDDIEQKGIDKAHFYNLLQDILKPESKVVMYNAAFDLGFIPNEILTKIQPHCAMNTALALISELPEYETPSNFLKLNNVAFLFDLNVYDLDLLTSLGDAELCRRVWSFMTDKHSDLIHEITTKDIPYEY